MGEKKKKKNLFTEKKLQKILLEFLVKSVYTQQWTRTVWGR